MMRSLRTVFVLAIVGLLSAPGFADHHGSKPQPTTTIVPTADEQAMLLAIADAQVSFPVFWDAYQAAAPGTERFAVKVRLAGGSDGVEHLWVTDLARNRGGYTGRIGNEPETLARTYTKGDTVSFSPMDVTDWGYADGNKLRGHYTTRARIPKMGAMEADQIRSLLHDNPLPEEN